MSILFYIIYGSWGLSEIILNRMKRSGAGDVKTKDKNTELYLWLTIAASISVGAYVSLHTFYPIYLNIGFIYLSLGLIVVGIIIRFTAIRQLGKFFTMDVTIKSDHQIVNTGLYGWVRHPSYSGALLSFIGLGLSMNNYYGFLIIVVPIFLAFSARISVEEQALTEAFGAAYQSYSAATKRLIPFIY